MEIGDSIVYRVSQEAANPGSTNAAVQAEGCLLEEFPFPKRKSDFCAIQAFT